MELAVLLSRDESAILEYGKEGEVDYDSLLIRLRRFVTSNTSSDKDPRVLGLDEDNELYEVVIPTDE